MDDETKTVGSDNQPALDLRRSLNDVVAATNTVLAALSNLSIEEELADAVDQGRASTARMVSNAVAGPKADAIASINAIAPTLQTNINDFLDALKGRAEEIGNAVAQIDLALEQEMAKADDANEDSDLPAQNRP